MDDMNMVTAEEVKKIASLARLELSDEEVQKAAKNMSSVLEHFSSIKDIPTDDIEEGEMHSDTKNISREDVADISRVATAEEVLLRVPRTKDGYIEVPGVFSDQEVS